MFVWVKAHAGDPGNEAADVQAGAGCFTETTHFERTTEPLIMYELETQRILTKQGWTPTVERFSREYEGGIMTEHLRHTSEAMSTDSLLKEGAGREMLGRVMMNKDITERAIRDLLQGRSYCLPTAAVVSRNKGGTTSNICTLCWKAPKTFIHTFMECEELAGAQSLMHDKIAACLLKQLGIHLGGARCTIHQGKAMDYMWPWCKGETIGTFVPDGAMIVEPAGIEKGMVILLEFARGASERRGVLDAKAQQKKNQYGNAILRLRQCYQRDTVELQTYIMGVLTSYNQKDWEKQLKALGLKEAQMREVQYECVLECVMAGHRLNNTRRSRIEGLHASEPTPPAGIG
jgi:hypothetical protein